MNEELDKQSTGDMQSNANDIFDHENDNNKPELNRTTEEEKDNEETSFTRALREKYCYDDSDYVFGSSLVTFHGKAKTGGAKAELAHLRNVVLSESSLTHAGLPSEGLGSLCPNVIDLDLSCNKLTNWKELIPIFYQLPHLQFVNLTYNKIQSDEQYLESLERPLENIQNLVLNWTGIKWREVIKLARNLPSLKELHICNNDYTDLGDVQEDALKNVECLRANNNNITRWSEVWKLHKLSKLQSLILSGNPIQDVFYDPDHTIQSDHRQQNNSSHASSDHSGKISTSTEGALTEACETDDPVNKSCDNSQVSSAKNELLLECENIVSDLVSTAMTTVENHAKNDKYQENISNNDVTNKTDDVMHKNNDLIINKADEVVHKNKNCVPTSVQESKDASNSRLCYDSIQSEDGEIGARLRPTSADKLSDEKEATEDQEQIKPFRNLHTLCMTETSVHHWEHLEALSKFPSLKSVRLRDIPLYKEQAEEDKRRLLLASLPNIEIFNGSEVTNTDRENSERFYIRHYSDEEVKPNRVTALEEKHGKLSKIVDIDISGNYQEYATLQFYLNGKKSFTQKLCMRDTLDKLRKFVCRKLNLSIYRKFIMYHFPCSPAHKYYPGEFPEKEKLVCNMPLSRYNMYDGDEIHIETDIKVQENDVRVVIRK